MTATMRSRNVIGRKIIRVDQDRVSTPTGPALDLTRMVLDNGFSITFSVVETEGEYVIEGTVHRPKDLHLHRRN